MSGRKGFGRWSAIGMAGMLALSLTAVTGSASAAEDEGLQKVILDTDMVELFDDGMAMVLLDQAPNIDLLGVTVVSGNTPMPRGMATGVRQLEATRSDTPIYAGSRFGIRNWRWNDEVMAAEEGLSPVVSWPGMYGKWDDTVGGDPMADWVEVYQSLYSEDPQHENVFEEGTPDADGNDNAVDFLVEAVNKYPGEVTVVAVGPLTNIARAVMKDPTFPSKVKTMVYMGGSFYLPGNSSAAAEFNWWADPEAAKVAVRQQWGDPDSETYELYGNQVIAGLEANHLTGAMPEDLYYEMVENTYPGMQELFAAREEGLKERGAESMAPGNIWDLFAAAWVIDPSVVLSWNDDPRPEGDVPDPIYGVYVDVDTNDGLNYGRSLAFREDVGPAGTQKAAIENYIDEDKFWTEMVLPFSADPER